MDYVKRQRSIWIVYLLAALVAASALILVWSASTIPISKQSVYVGAITFWTAISLTLWGTLSLGCACVSIWAHIKHRAFRKQVWAAFIASQTFYFSVLLITGAVINHSLTGTVKYDDSSPILLICSVFGFAMALWKGKFFGPPIE